MRIAVVGGGIGGLAAALSLAAAGFAEVDVFERSEALGEVGAGIQISPNGSRVLHRLGLEEALAAVAVRPATVDMRRWEDWSLLSRGVLGDAVEAEFGFPYYHVHRAELHRLLAAALAPERLHLGHRLAGLEPTADATALHFADGSSATADVVVGADGIHSAVRAALLGPEAPRFSGSSAWRGLVPAERRRRPRPAGGQHRGDGTRPTLRPLLRARPGGTSTSSGSPRPRRGRWSRGPRPVGCEARARPTTPVGTRWCAG